MTDGAGDGALTRSVAGMGAAAAVSRAFGGLRVVVIAAVLGTTYLGNTFQSSNSFSNVLFELMAAGALSAVLVPTFVELLHAGEERRVEEVAGGLLSVALVALGVVSLVGVLLAPLFARLLTSGVADPAISADQRELATFLLRFFIPQIVLYGIGAVATGLLHARGRFALTAIAPIGNTVVLVASIAVFQVMAGSDPGLELSSGERLCLALGGTLGVVAFVGIPAVGLWRTGHRWRLSVRRGATDPEVRRLLRLSGWTVVQHASNGLLLVAALIVCGGVAGGVVAYQLAMVVFLAPYGIIAQPIHTAILPRLAADRTVGGVEAMHSAVRWAVDVVVAITLPVTAVLLAVAGPMMHVLALGEAAKGDGPTLLGSAMVGLAVGIPAYGGFLLLTRVAYAIGDSRTPAFAALGSSLLGFVGMFVAGAAYDGSARLVAVGLAHTLAYLVGAIALGVRLRSATGPLLSVGQLRAVGLSAAVGLAAWAGIEGWAPDGRLVTVLAVALVSGGALAAYLGALHATGGLPPRSPAALGPVEQPA